MRNALTAGMVFFARSGDLWLAASLLIAGTYLFSGRFTPVRFDEERIDVRVEQDLIQVTGLYHYRNQSRLPAVLTLRVPFPVDPEHPRPESFSLSEVNEGGRSVAEVPLSRRGEEVRFRLLFRPGAAKWIRLDYTQPTRVSNGRYLLTTTRAWRHPIDHAVFTLRLSPGFRLGSSNYALAASPPSPRGEDYSFSRTDFYPDQDWQFAWEEPRPAAPQERGLR